MLSHLQLLDFTQKHYVLCQSKFKNFAKCKIKNCQTLLKVAKFRQIWSHWFLLFYCVIQSHVVVVAIKTRCSCAN